MEEDQTKHKEMEENVEKRPRAATKNNKRKVVPKMAASFEVTRGQNVINKRKNSFKCDQCNLISNKKITLQKHINIKHNKKESENHTGIKIGDSECFLCKDKFSSEEELKKHKREHIEEKDQLDISSLTNGNEMFECNLCSFESGVGDSIREYLIDHVNPPAEDKQTKK